MRLKIQCIKNNAKRHDGKTFKMGGLLGPKSSQSKGYTEPSGYVAKAMVHQE
jgi:hypothetical protein